MKKLDYPLAPLVLAMVIGDKAEDAFRQSMLMSGGSLDVLWSNALVGTLSTIATLFLLWPLASAVMGWRRTSKAMKAAQAEPST
jgi:putative tricarboxylic transport membrane protein